MTRAAVALFAGALVLAAAAMGQSAAERRLLGDRVTRLTRETVWRRVAVHTIGFDAHHPQGMVRVGSTLYVSAVEIRRRTTPMAVPDARYDRDAGDGVGHLFKVAPDGRLLGSARIGSGTIYHPGGLDFDGRSIWVAVAEYRPNSRAIVYRVNPDTLRAAEVLRVGDHLGAVAYDTERRELHAVSWGARRFYRWTFGPDGELRDREAPRVQPNPSHYVDYQDCKYAGRERMLCSGVATLHRGSGEAPFRLGGLDLVSLRDGRPLHQVPVLLWTPGGLDMTHNAAWFEPTENGIRAYFMPEDGVSSVHVYDADGR